jgi:isoquinoline 1-oxidoreductase beta subunit
MLVAAAAAAWGVPPAECRARLGEIIHEPSGRRVRFGAVAQAASRLEPPEQPALKDEKEFALIGKALARLDVPAKAEGTAQYGMDVKLPGMLTAQVAHPPFGGKLARFDGAAAKQVPGVVDVVEIPTGVAVVGEHFWAAKQGRDALVTEWDGGAWSGLSTASIRAMCTQLVGKGKQARKDGDPSGALRRARLRLDAVYEVPYLAHATMEPMNCTAHVRPDGVDVWVGTQSPSSVRARAAEIAGVGEDRVVVHPMMLGGGFGRRSQTDFVEDAVHVAKALGKPVKVVWSREDDTGAGFYRPMSYNELSGGVDADGWPVAWVHRIASPSILEGFGRPIPGGVDPTSIDGAADLPYRIPNVLVTCAKPELPITLWFWRSVGSSQNAYVAECFFDELCRLGGKDPVDARLHLLDDPRYRKVVEVAADKAGWGTAPPAGRARGIAVRKSFGTYVAQVAEVSLDGAVPRVHRVTVAVDPGKVIHPDTIASQMESGIAYGLSAALFGKIDIDAGRAVQANFDRYPILRLPQMPKVDVHLVPSGDDYGGIGEPGLPPAAPALCNALLALTGRPVRTLPIT